MVPPGSFTKNFGWGTNNFERLHHAIAQGFAGNAVPTSREIWRGRNAAMGESLPLLALNFFLLNRGLSVLPDELVSVALTQGHTTVFDGLAFFALNLSAVGTPPGTLSRPAPWAGRFISEFVWNEGIWKAPTDPIDLIETVVREGVTTASAQSFRKICNNYRWIFGFARHRQARIGTDLWSINSGFQEWLPNALFLTWDRLSAPTDSLERLLAILSEEQVHKLAGCPSYAVDSISQEAATRYINSGRLGRFNAATVPNLSDLEPVATEPLAVALGLTVEPPTDPAEFTGAVAPPQRTTRTTQAILRDSVIVDELKEAYGNACAICGIQLHVGGGTFYSEGAHILPLGSPHNGPDIKENILPLCPNHHKQFDRGAISITPDGRIFERLPSGEIRSATPPLAVFRHPVGTPVGQNFLRWHFEHSMGGIPPR